MFLVEGLASQPPWPESKQTEKAPPNNSGPDSLTQRRDGGEENGGEVVEGFRELKP